MFESSTKKTEFINIENFNSENLPSFSENHHYNNRAVLYLSPDQRFSKTKLKFKRILSRQSQWYDWFEPAPKKIWLQGEKDELTGCYKRKFSEYVHFEKCFDYYQMFPVAISFRDSTGKHQKYTPLTLLNFSTTLKYCSMKPVLVDVKSAENIKENWNWFYPAWRAARLYAKQRGWNFCLVREDFFSTPLYKNAAFLLRYRNNPKNKEYFRSIMKEMHRLETTTIQELLNNISQNDREKIKILSQLWQLMGANYIFFDIKQSITMNSVISI